jgi:FkbM family methyltransferase
MPTVANPTEIEQLRARIAQLEGESQNFAHWVGQVLNQTAVRMITRSSPGSYFECEFNGVVVMLPRDTLRTMTHCVHARADQPLLVAVETIHLDWLRSRLGPGDTFLDVGSATGAMTLPIAVGIPGVRVVAFEPSRTARRILLDTLAINRVTAVEVHDAAVSDAAGTVQFSEMRYDESGRYPYLPETSTISTDRVDPAHESTRYDVRVVSLDEFFAGRPDARTVRAVKIDVEGFETNVVRGGTRFLAESRPHMAIDIHTDPFGDGTTEDKVRGVLAQLGYTFQKSHHVLLCVP